MLYLFLFQMIIVWIQGTVWGLGAQGAQSSRIIVPNLAPITGVKGHWQVEYLQVGECSKCKGMYTQNYYCHLFDDTVSGEITVGQV